MPMNEAAPPAWLDALLDGLADRVACRLAKRLAAVAPLPAANEPMQEEGVSVREAAERLDVSPRTVARGITDGTIPSMKVRGRRVVLLRQYLAENGSEEVERRARAVLRSA